MIPPDVQKYLISGVIGFIVAALGGYWILGRQVAEMKGMLSILLGLRDETKSIKKTQYDHGKKFVRIESRITRLEGNDTPSVH